MLTIQWAVLNFFHFMIQAFIKHVLGVDANHTGLYGDTSSYYGIVKQQGCFTLHSHMLLWIRGALTPQEIRDQIMDPESDFQKKVVEYLESVHMGEFITGSLEDVKKMWTLQNLMMSTKIQLKHFQYHLCSNVIRMNAGNASPVKLSVHGKLNLILL